MCHATQPKLHSLKITPMFFRLVQDRSKTSELRRNDRDFQLGDDLILEEWDPQASRYTGRFVMATITHVLKDFEGLAEGYAILSFKKQGGNC